ncbi:hypothetical protein NDU88_003784 [Pleurodeles waltl]|uniref:Uncharacterized protein n=1 Tax=Pleurodeles waltl TaxID=8319 RepID=A0AAV7PAL0_PLEWA|nr:hypothetical protein NDU88_003784 [Pleurodeles waltl]
MGSNTRFSRPSDYIPQTHNPLAEAISGPSVEGLEGSLLTGVEWEQAGKRAFARCEEDAVLFLCRRLRTRGEPIGSFQTGFQRVCIDRSPALK